MRAPGRRFQSTRPVRGETSHVSDVLITTQFQSTRPVRGETKTAEGGQHPGHISIHSPRAGRDTNSWKSSNIRPFQSTRPVRGETKTHKYLHRAVYISIHSPRAGRDRMVDRQIRSLIISIHSPRAGRDWIHLLSVSIPMIFQSTRPVRGETVDPAFFKVDIIISIHSPRAGRDTS